MMDKDIMITVVNGLGDKFRLPMSQLEAYRKQQEEFMRLHQEITGQVSPIYEIKEIIEE